VTKFIRDSDNRGVFRFEPTSQVVNSKQNRGSNETEFQMNGVYFPEGNAAMVYSKPEVRQ
jgi:hypothetical protein